MLGRNLKILIICSFCFVVAACGGGEGGEDLLPANPGNDGSGASDEAPEAPVELQLVGLANELVPSADPVWTWSCSTICEYRFVVDQSPTFEFVDQPFELTSSAAASGVDGTYYLHVQAKEVGSDRKTQTMHVSVVLDKTAPTDPVIDAQLDDATESRSATVQWSGASDNIAMGPYQMAVGTSPGATDVSDFVEVGSGSQGFVTGLSLTSGVSYYSTLRAVDQAGNISAVVTGPAYSLPGPPAQVYGLTAVSVGIHQVEIGWAAPSGNGRVITDYYVEYRPTGDPTFTLYDDGVSGEPKALITGLSENTSYEFRVTAFNGSTGVTSSSLEVTTAVDDPFFDPTYYKAMNLGGAADSQVVAFEDGTDIELNEAPLISLDAGETHRFTSAQFDQLRSTKPFFVAGRLGAGGDNRKGNIVWSTPDWAGRDFVFTGTRNAPHLISVYAFEESTVEIYQGATLRAAQDIPAEGFYTFSISQHGGFRMVSSGLVIAYFYSSGGSTVVDPRPLLPASTDILGVPSTAVKFTSVSGTANYTLYHSDSVTATGTVTAGGNKSISGRGANRSYYQGEALRIQGDLPLVGNSNADSNGYCSAPFVPTAFLKKRYAINVSAQYVAFASLEAGDIDIVDPDTGVTTTVSLVRSGTEELAPYKAYLTGQKAGTIYQSTVRFATWYEPSTDTGAADNDETILFGFE